jgi:hypothetical protein
MNPEIIQALQAALDAQFKAGTVVGRLETLIAQAMPQVAESPIECEPAPTAQEP